MARIRKNVLLAGVSGMIGKNIVVKQTARGGVMANKPKKRRKNSPLQEEQVSRFTLGIRYSRERRALPGMEALYATGITENKFSAHHVAVSDFLNAPEIHEIDAKDYHGNPGDIIRVRATDDFKVTSVKVIITDADGNVIETGEAMPRGKKGLWRMAATIQCTNLTGAMIKIEANDVAGNITRATFSLATGELIILPDPYKETSKRLSEPVVVRASDNAHSHAVGRESTAAHADKAIDHGNGESVKQTDQSELPDRGQLPDRGDPIHAKGSEALGHAILAVLRSAFPDVKVEIVEQTMADDALVTKCHLRVWLE